MKANEFQKMEDAAQAKMNAHNCCEGQNFGAFLYQNRQRVLKE